MSRNRRIVLAFVPITVIGLIFGFCLSMSGVSQSSVNYYGFTATAQTSNSTLGLRLDISINSTHISPSQGISINITENNILARTNNVSAVSNWSIANLLLGPCGNGVYPFGAAVFRGYWSSSNISSATHLNIFRPGIYMCPAGLSVQYYLFQPMSDYSSIYSPSANGSSVQCCSLPGHPLPISSVLNFNSYWDSFNVEHNLGRGVYTVAAGDEWGQLVLLHFAVV
jgi:hypothetical protein